MPFKRIYLIVADSLGVGEEPDAARFGDVGSNTFKHASYSLSDFAVPTLASLGVGALDDINNTPDVPSHPHSYVMRLREESKELVPVLRLIPFDSLENLLADGEIHLIFSFQEGAPKRVHYRELTRCPPVCVCAEGHPLAAHDSLTLTQLKKVGRIATCRPPICPAPLFSIQSRIAAEQGTGQMLFCDNQEVIHTLVATGYAFAVMPDFPQLRLPGLRYIPLSEFSSLSFGAVYLPGERNPALKRFLSLLEESFSAAAGGPASPS